MLGPAKDLVAPDRKIFNALVHFEDAVEYSYTELREAPVGVRENLQGQVVAELLVRLKHGVCELFELDPDTVTTGR